MARRLLCDPGGIEIFLAVFSAPSAECDPTMLAGIFRVPSGSGHHLVAGAVAGIQARPEVLHQLAVAILPAPLRRHRRPFVPIPRSGHDDPDRRCRTAGDSWPTTCTRPATIISTIRRPRSCFPGDVGAALLPPDQSGCTSRISRAIRHAEGFHKRWMGSDRAKRDWCERVSRLEIDMLVPQHGAIYRGRRAALHQLVLGTEVGVLCAARVEPRNGGAGDCSACRRGNGFPRGDMYFRHMPQTFPSPASC